MALSIKIRYARFGCSGPTKSDITQTTRYYSNMAHLVRGECLKKPAACERAKPFTDLLLKQVRRIEKVYAAL